MNQTREALLERINEFVPPERSYLSLGNHERAKGFHRLWYAPPISHDELLGKSMDETGGHDELQGFKLGDKQILFFTLEWVATGSLEVIGFMNARVHGGDVNKVLFSLAPNKNYHIDTQDIVTDWNLIDARQELMERHTKSLGLAWTISERSRKRIVDEIEKWQRLDQDPETDGDTVYPSFVPVIRFDDKGHWIFDRLDSYPYSQLRACVSEEFFPGKEEQKQSEWFDPTIGLWVAAHLSPDIVKPWEAKYNRVSLEKNGTERENSASRAGVFTIMRSFELRNSEFMRASRRYIQENSVPVMLK